MSDKIERYNGIVVDMTNLVTRDMLIGVSDNEVEQEAASLIRELRRIIERLRRVVDDEQPPIEVHSLQDAMRLNKDELAYVAWQFFQWINYDERCPADKCLNFPCQYRQEVENDYANNYSEEDLKKYKELGFDANKWCEGDPQGCWAEYYLWCYRNGVNPLNGKKEAK